MVGKLLEERSAVVKMLLVRVSDIKAAVKDATRQ